MILIFFPFLFTIKILFVTVIWKVITPLWSQLWIERIILSGQFTLAFYAAVAFASDSAIVKTTSQDWVISMS